MESTYLGRIAMHELRYLKLLNLGPRSSRAIAELIRGTAKAPSPWDDVFALLEEVDWRAHLPAIICALVLPIHTDAVSVFWRRFDRGSWVGPQLAVGLYFLDRDFPKHALARLHTRCVRPPLPERGSLIRSLPRRLLGRKTKPHFDRKALGALMYLSGGIPELSPTVADIKSTLNIPAYERGEFESGSEIAEYWRAQIVELLGQQEIDLRKRFHS